MIEQQELQDFFTTLTGEVRDLDGEAPASQIEWDTRLCEVALGYLEEAGYAEEPVPCLHEDRAGRNLCRLIAYSFRDDNQTLDLYTGLFQDTSRPTFLTQDDVLKLSGRAAKFFQHAAAGELERFSANPGALAAATAMKENLGAISLVRVTLLTNGLVRERDSDVDSVEIAGKDVDFAIMDLGRMFKIAARPTSREDIDIDFVKLQGRLLPVLEVLPKPEEYETYLAIFPGDLIYALYETYGPRLLEFNVRSFLQARGKVNRGLRDTLKDTPERFLAYNNGLTATVDEVEVSLFHGQPAISRLKGLQIVNGGQTTASIHRARKQDNVDLSRVAVAVKITRVREDKLLEYVPLISKYSNTQNVIQVADLSANHSFHIEIERLAETVWCPAEKERWSYERARGSYQAAMGRLGTTQAKARDFRRENPPSKKFTKTDLTKFIMSWIGRPHDVSRGAQKNFGLFMDELNTILPGKDWRPDEEFFRQVVAKGIVFKATEKVVRQEQFPAYRANIVTYLVAYFAYRYGDRIDLGYIWASQEISDKLKELLRAWSHSINQCIIESAAGRNVTEWAKKEECWKEVQGLDLFLPEEVPPEVSGAQAAEVAGVTRNQIANDIERCESIPAADWVRIVEWGRSTGRLQDIEWKVARTMADYAMEGWSRHPSPRQIRFACKALDLALQSGVLNLPQPVDKVAAQ